MIICINLLSTKLIKYIKVASAIKERITLPIIAIF